MALVAGVTAEGVLCRSERPGALFGSYLPIPPGVRLLRALSGLYQVAVVTSEPNQDVVEHWLMVNGLSDNYSTIVVPRSEPTRAAQWRYLRSVGSLDYVIDPSPSDVAWAASEGITALLFSHPLYARPEWRPDDERGVRAWGEIEAEVEQQAQRRSTDRRLSDVGSGRYED